MLILHAFSKQRYTHKYIHTHTQTQTHALNAQYEQATNEQRSCDMQ